MKFCVTYFYWIILLISVVSSGLLFLIEVSEGVQIPHTSSEKDESYGVTNNFSIDESNEEFQEANNPSISDVDASESIKTDNRDSNVERTEPTGNSFQVPSGSERGKKAEGIEVLAESLTQQPNLSQGISDTGQAVVLTLVDTAAAELQSLADPEIVSEFAARSLTNNLTLTSATASEPEQSLEPTTESEINVVLSTEQVNDSASSEAQSTKNHEENDDVLVVVRAEAKSGLEEIKTEEELKSVEEVLAKEDVLKEEDFSSTSELNDSAARAQLVEGTTNDASTIILDGIPVPGSPDTHEDIPSFSEWAQKRLEEAEKKKTHPNVSVQNPGGPGKNVGGMKMRSKNYASPDCGAKIVAANPETRSAKNVLVSTRDEYMLNTCTSKIWFVVELCEAIQAKKIELANFELFSSSPKDFSVYVSDRFPTRDWSSVGHFTAKDERDIQSFTLNPHLFGKFIKIELHSHYGSEHFCPISLFRAYGTSEFEVLETETDVQVPTSDDEDENENAEDPLDLEGGEPTRNLFGSARDAVLSIVRKAAEVLIKTGDLSRNNITKIQESIRGEVLQSSLTSCTTPRYAIVCKNCTDDQFARVFQILSCRDRYLSSLLDTSFVRDTLRYSHLCWIHKGKSEEDSFKPQTCKARYLQATFLASVLTPDYIVALCNVLAARDGKVLLNSSDEVAPVSDNETSREETFRNEKREHIIEVVQPKITAPCSIDTSSLSCRPTITIQESPRLLSEETEASMVTSAEMPSTSEILASQIKPTKTLIKEEMKKESSLPVLEQVDSVEESSHHEILTTPSPVVNIVSPTLTIQEELTISVENSGRAENWVPTSSVLNNEQEKQEISEKESDMKIHEVPEIKSSDAKSEGQEEEVKQNKSDSGEEAKIISQEHMNFDSLLSDFKEFEGEAMHNGHGGSLSANHPTASSTPQQKESVFLRLSNRIKALERNMSLSGQYLEELSRRYKKQVEEMQRALERATLTMSEESRKGEERDTRRLEEIAVLREEIKFLSKSVESLLYDRDSWQSKLLTLGQHVILMCVNVILVILVISYCRKSIDFDEEVIEQDLENKKLSSGKSTNILGRRTHLIKKPKKRRPSEIASNISGNYQDLMIGDPQISVISKKEKKKKRKKDTATNVASNGDNRIEVIRYKGILNQLPNSLPSRRASSIDAPSLSIGPLDFIEKRPDSAPENYTGWFNDQIEKNIDTFSSFDQREVERIGDERSTFENELHLPSTEISVLSNEGEIKPTKKGSRAAGLLKAKLSSPSFMKTALGSRSKRISITNNGDKKLESSENRKISNQGSISSLQTVPEGLVNGTATNGHVEESNRSSNATPILEKKEKKTYGLKKMVRKLF